MPRRDGTGPEGAGSQTGRGLGNCSPKNTSTNSEQTANDKRGLGRCGCGGGRGLGNGGRGSGRKQ